MGIAHPFQKPVFVFASCFMVLIGCNQNSPPAPTNSSQEPLPNKERVADVSALVLEKSTHLNSAIFRAEADNGGNVAAGAEDVFKSLVASQYVSSETLTFPVEMGNSFWEYHKGKYVIKYSGNNFGGDGKDDVLFFLMEKNAFNKEVCLAIQKKLKKPASIPTLDTGVDYFGVKTDGYQGCGEPIGTHYIYYHIMTTN